MYQLFAVLCAAVFMLSFGSTRAEAQTACDFYRIERGESLREIAERAYGDDNFRRIYQANRSQIGRNPNIVVVGTVLALSLIHI